MKDYLLGAENTVMKKLKIAVDARTLGSRPSGVGMYLNDFLEQLITYDEFEWILFTDVKESEYIKRFEARGIKVIEWGKPVYRSAGVYAYFAFIKKELKQVRPDIFWEVNSIIPINLGGSFKTLITIHDMFPIQYVRYFGKIYSYYFKFNLGVTLRHTDIIRSRLRMIQRCIFQRLRRFQAAMPTLYLIRLQDMYRLRMRIISCI